MLKSLAHLSYKFVFFFFICMSSLDSLDVSSLSDVSVVNTSSATQLRSRIWVSPLNRFACSRSLEGPMDVSNFIRQTWISYFWALYLLTLPSLLKLSPNQMLAPFFIQLPGPILLNSFLHCGRKITNRKSIQTQCMI